MSGQQSWNRRALGELYETCFDPDDYLKTYYTKLDAEVEFFLRNLHEFFASRVAGESSVETCGGKRVESGRNRVLEVGSGPTVTSIISASRWSERIICSDFLEANRKKISHWLATIEPTSVTKERGESDSDIWDPFFHYVAQLETKACSQRCSSTRRADVARMKRRVKQSVQSVVACNVFLENPLINSCRINPSVDGRNRFQVIVSTLCLEFASPSIDDYRRAVANVVSLLSPSGYIIMQGALGNTHYWHNGRKFPSVQLNRNDVEEALKDAGCVVCSWEELKRSCSAEEKPADHSACFCCVACKLE